MTAKQAHAAILFEPDGYVQATPKLMGRQAAGHGFLRAAVNGREGAPLWGYTPSRQSAEVFGREVKAIDASAEARWCPSNRLDLLEQIGALYMPGPDLETAGRLRLRRGAAAYSLCGVTHTTASHRAMDSLSTLATAPVMPWDALICTSSAVAETVRIHRAAEADYLRWRFGQEVKAPDPLLPVIPLGVHAADYAFSDAERTAARAAFGFAEDEVVVLFVGRLSFHAKAHPDATYVGLEAAARQTGARIALLQAGWFANEFIEKAFKEGAQAAAPSVRAVYADARQEQTRRHAWAAADIFISLSDNIQETFGLTPIEAMAAALPVVVTDWDGYKDTVRDGVDGFRVPTWMASEGAVDLALDHESGHLNYDHYCGFSCQTVAVDMGALVRSLALLVSDGDARKRLGAAGRERARTHYDWSVVYRQYRALWGELGAIRERAAGTEEGRALVAAAPRSSPSRLDPSVNFAHYATNRITPDTLVVASERPDGLGYEALVGSALFSYAEGVMSNRQLAEAIRAAAQARITVEQVGQKLGVSAKHLMFPVAMLAKMGLLRLSAPG